MNGYIAKVLLKYGQPSPKKPQLSPHKHREVIYGAKEQLAPKYDTTLPLDSQKTKRVQGTVGALLYYARSVDIKLLVGLSAIGSQQASATKHTNEAIDKILDYCATYPSDGISIALATWSSVRILTQGSTMRAKDAAETERIFSSLKTMPCPDGTDLC